MRRIFLGNHLFGANEKKEWVLTWKMTNEMDSKSSNFHKIPRIKKGELNISEVNDWHTTYKRAHNLRTFDKRQRMCGLREINEIAKVILHITSCRDVK